MAMPTTTQQAPPPRQAPTPGVGMQGAPPPMAPAEAARPVLFDDIDPVLLVRLYPGAENAADMRAQAMAAGEAAYEQGATLVASQQEPVLELDEAGAPISRRDQVAERLAGTARPYQAPPQPYQEPLPAGYPQR